MAGRRASEKASGGRREGPARAPLSREQILATGLALLERSPGTELSMRDLAAELGTAPMSLYRHVANREDLLEGVNRLALESLQLEVPDDGRWDERALAWMHALRNELHAHPAVTPLLRLHGTLAPTLFHVLDSLLHVVQDAGFEGRQAALAVREIAWFTLSFARAELSSPGGDPGSYERLSAEDLSGVPELAAHLPFFADIDVDEIFSQSARHLIEGLAHNGKRA